MMRIQGLASGIAIVATSLSAAVFGDAQAQSAGADAEIAALKQQLRLMEQKLDKLQRQTAANTTAAATANCESGCQGQRCQRSRLSSQEPDCAI